jgi:hypothetical protein
MKAILISVIIIIVTIPLQLKMLNYLDCMMGQIEIKICRSFTLTNYDLHPTTELIFRKFRLKTADVQTVAICNEDGCLLDIYRRFRGAY